MKLKATIDNIALSALVFAVVSIAAVSTVAVVSVESLIFTNERILRAQRVVSSLEAIRFQALGIHLGEQSFLVSGNDLDLGRYRSGVVEIEGELTYLAGKSLELPEISERIATLDKDARTFIAAVRSEVEERRKAGAPPLPASTRERSSLALQEALLANARQLLVQARRQQDSLEADQVVYGDKVRRLILALISSSAFVLVFLYGTLRRLNIEQRTAQMRIAHQATHDSLTGMFNRAAVMDHISTRLRDAESEAALGGFALLLLDLDGFKAINDNQGHDAGDALLREVAKRILGSLRASDYCARLGGDEFLIVIPQVSDRETAEQVSQKLIRNIAVPVTLGGLAVTVTASIGIGMFPRDASDRESLMKCADLALYQAKRTGRNRWVFYDPGMGATNSRF